MTDLVPQQPRTTLLTILLGTGSVRASIHASADEGSYGSISMRSTRAAELSSPQPSKIAFLFALKFDEAAILAGYATHEKTLRTGTRTGVARPHIVTASVTPTMSLSFTMCLAMLPQHYHYARALKGICSTSLPWIRPRSPSSRISTRRVVSIKRPWRLMVCIRVRLIRSMLLHQSHRLRHAAPGTRRHQEASDHLRPCSQRKPNSLC